MVSKGTHPSEVKDTMKCNVFLMRRVCAAGDPMDAPADTAGGMFSQSDLWRQILV